MNRRRGLSVTALAILLAVCFTRIAQADDRRHEYSPEFNAFHNFGGMRLFLLGSTTKVEGVDALQNQVGAHLDISTKRGVRERLHLADWARDRSLGLRIGYRQFRHWDGEREDVNERRGLAEVTWRGTLPYQFGMSHRLGYDYRDRDSGASQRYRYRFNLDRDATLWHTALVPYFQAEVTYDTRYTAWSKVHYQLGSEIGISKHWRIEPYLSVDEDVKPAKTYSNKIGLIAKLYW